MRSRRRPTYELTPIAEWKVLGTEQPAPAARDKVLGRHQFPSDIKRPGMLYGRVLRSPKYRGKLTSVDLAPAKEMDGVVAVQDGDFVGVAAPTAFAAKQAIEAVAKTAKWEAEPMPSSDELYDYLRENADGDAGRIRLPTRLAKAAKSLKATYTSPTCSTRRWSRARRWPSGPTASSPCGRRRRIRSACAASWPERFDLPEDDVRVIVPDFGSGYGGKHTGECAVEAARIAKAAGKPVMLRWTREEEFTWAYFRPAAVIDMEASLDDGESARHVVSRQHQLGRQLDRFAVRCAAEAVAVGRLAAAAAARFVSCAGVDRQLVCPRVVHGRNGGGRGRRSARVSAGPPQRSATAAGARGGGQAIQLDGARERQAAESRRRPGVQHRQGLVRRLLRGSGSRSARETRSTCVDVCEAFDCGPVMNPGQPAQSDGRGDHHGPGAGASRGDAVRRRRDQERQLRALPRAAFQGRADDRNATR